MAIPETHATQCHDANLSVPQPTRLQKQLLLSAISLVWRFRRRVGSVLMLTNDICVKYGPRIDIVEAQTIMYIAKHTKIPVPKIYLAFTHKEYTYILMQRIHGEPLVKGWLQRPQASRMKILASLKKQVDEMRTLHSHSAKIGSVIGSSLYDPRLPSAGRFGPFEGVKEFHDFLRDDIQAHDGHNDDVKELIWLHDQHWDAPTFTHGDLSSFNVLVRGDEVVGIIDWETAGWYPSYWEYTTACQVNPRNDFWRDEIDNFLEARPKALLMEQLRQRYFGDF